MAPRTVVFDLDHTLAVTDRDRQELLDEATDRAGTGPVDRETYLSTHSDVDATETRAPVFERLVDESDAEALATAYRDAILDALEPVPGAGDLLRTLGAEYTLGLLTDGPKVAQESKLDRLGWWDLFDAVVVTGTLPAGKPDPQTFETICDRLGIDPADAVYIGDRPEKDIEGATDVGMTAIQVTFPDGPSVSPDAVATVERNVLAERLPGILADL